MDGPMPVSLVFMEWLWCPLGSVGFGETCLAKLGGWAGHE